MLQITHYAAEHYSTMFNPDTGFFARVEDEGRPEPFWSEHGPELIDISVTNWCDRDCGICYRRSGYNGVHISLPEYEMILRQAASLGVIQVAIGGGNPNQHPDFVTILQRTREAFGIVPSYTTNGRGLTAAVLEASAAYCGAVAVSAYEPYAETATAVELLATAGARVNIHFVLTASSIETAIAWLQDPPSFFEHVNAVVFLNFKPIGRGSTRGLLANSSALGDFFTLVQRGKQPFKIGFDSCMVSGVTSMSHVPHCFYDACEAGRFSMFISETLRAYPCSFMEASAEGGKVDDRNLLSIWQNHPAFDRIREQIRTAQCNGCDHLATCMGGCPVFPTINLCGRSRSLDNGQ